MGYPLQAIRCIKCWRKEPLIHTFSDPGSSVERIALVYTWKEYSYLQQNYPADQSSSGMRLGFFIWLLMFLRLQHGVLRKLQPGVLRKAPWVSGGRWAFTEISLGLVLCSDEAGCWTADLAPRAVWGGVSASPLVGCAPPWVRGSSLQLLQSSYRFHFTLRSVQSNF